jgi:hypothetical protein
MYQQGNFQYNDNGTVSQLTEANATVGASTIIVPIDIQSRLASTIQTHNAVSVGISGLSNSSWIDTDGFSDVAISLINDAATATTVDLNWSSDGATQQGFETLLSSSTNRRRSGSTSTKMRYLQVVLNNGDASLAHTMSAYAYLKA